MTLGPLRDASRREVLLTGTVVAAATLAGSRQPARADESWAGQKRRVSVLGHEMAYVERGEGRPVVLLHGNPTSSYLWRGVLPHLTVYGRMIAPDLMGMGDSDKLPAGGPGRYRFTDHARYLAAFLTAVGADRDVTMVLHDWGGALGFDWAYHHQHAVRGMAYMETFVRPLTLADLPESFHPTLRAVRSAEGEQLVLQENMFIERMLPGVTQRKLTEGEMAEYRRPFLRPGDDRAATLAWPREVPLSGEPADVAARMDAYSAWLREGTVPKLFVNADPGVFITGDVRALCRTFPHQQEVTVKGLHFVQEDSPDEIGQAVSGWLTGLP